MAEQPKESLSRMEHRGVTYFISIAQLLDGRWDTWIRFPDAAQNVLGHDVGVFDDEDVARETAITTAQLLIEQMPPGGGGELLG